MPSSAPSGPTTLGLDGQRPYPHMMSAWAVPDGCAGRVTSAGNTGIPRHPPNLRPPRMSRSHPAPSLVGPLIASLWLAWAAIPAHAQLSANVMADVHALAQKEQQPLLDTLRELVSIESGSKDVEGLNQIAERVAGQLKQLGGTVEILQATDVYRLDDTPEKIGPADHPDLKGN